MLIYCVRIFNSFRYCISVHSYLPCSCTLTFVLIKVQKQDFCRRWYTFCLACASSYPDEDTSLNQLLELLKYKDMKFIESLRNESIDIDLCTYEEIVYLTKASALIDYYLQLHGIEVSN